MTRENYSQCFQFIVFNSLLSDNELIETYVMNNFRGPDLDSILDSLIVIGRKATDWWLTQTMRYWKITISSIMCRLKSPERRFLGRYLSSVFLPTGMIEYCQEVYQTNLVKTYEDSFNKFCLSKLKVYEDKQVDVCHGCSKPGQEFFVTYTGDGIYHLDVVAEAQQVVATYKIHEGGCDNSLDILPYMFNRIRNLNPIVDYRMLGIKDICEILSNDLTFYQGKCEIRKLGGASFDVDSVFLNSFPILTLVSDILKLNLTKNPTVVETMVKNVKQNNIKATYKKMDPNLTVTKKKALYKILHRIISPGNRLDPAIDSVLLRPEEEDLIYRHTNLNTIFDTEESDLPPLPVTKAISETISQNKRKVTNNVYNHIKRLSEKKYYLFEPHLFLRLIPTLVKKDTHIFEYYRPENRTMVQIKTPANLYVFRIHDYFGDVLLPTLENCATLFNKHLEYIKHLKFSARKRSLRQVILKKKIDCYFIASTFDKKESDVLDSITIPSLKVAFKNIKRLLFGEKMTFKSVPRMMGLTVNIKQEPVKNSLFSLVKLNCNFEHYYRMTSVNKQFKAKYKPQDYNIVEEMREELMKRATIARRSMLAQANKSYKSRAKDIKEADLNNIPLLWRHIGIHNKNQKKLMKELGDEAVHEALKMIFKEIIK
jgi:hypothetical protein